MKTGLFFGSFNPIHIGHMALANYFTEFTDLDQIWFVVSPHNPLKDKSALLANNARLEMVKIAIQNDSRFSVSDIEFSMPEPSYTIDTLNLLVKRYPKNEFVIIMGADGLNDFDKWKNYQEIIERFKRYVYPRHESDTKELEKQKNIFLVDAPRLEISSTFIRESIARGHDIRHFLPNRVAEYIKNKGYYIF